MILELTDENGDEEYVEVRRVRKDSLTYVISYETLDGTPASVNKNVTNVELHGARDSSYSITLRS